MSSLADAPDLVGFFSYSREDDEGSGGRLSKLRERIQEELRLQLGRTKRDFRLWQDKVAIAHGELWEETIKKGISESVFFIPIITPTAVRSSYCKFEFESFLAREKELDRNNLIFPILYVQVPALTDDRWRQDPLLAIIGSRQYEDWQNLRHLDASSSEVVALRVQRFCANVCRALQQPWLSPEERQQVEAQRVAEDERRRQEAITRFDNTTLRLAEAENEKRRQDEERTKQSGHEPQQQVEPWLLPLIGTGAASLPVLLPVAWRAATEEGVPPVAHLTAFPVVMIHALYGGAAGMLVRRFGIPKAVAIPVIPILLLHLVFILVVRAFFGISMDVLTLLLLFVSSVICAWLAFWLHSLWARKRRMIDSGLVPP
jgi:hypothetical protein